MDNSKNVFQNPNLQVGTLALARIESIMQFGASCRLIEFDDAEAFLPIREVSSGWIKNIHNFIHKGQVVVVKIISINKEKNTIDISLKRVTNADSRNKLNAYNLEKRAQALFLQAMKEARVSQFKDKYTSAVLSKYGSFTNFIDAINSKADSLAELPIPEKLKTVTSELLEAGTKEKTRRVVYDLTLLSYDTNAGIEQIKKALTEAAKQGVDIAYISAPHYRITAEAEDYSIAEGKIKAAMAELKKYMPNGYIALEKEKLKKEKEDILHTTYNAR